MFRRSSLSMIVLLASFSAPADEADQYLAWGVELTDSSDVLDAFVTDVVWSVLNDANSRPDEDCDCVSLTFDIFAAIYRDRLYQPLLNYVEESESVAVHPPRDVALSEILDLSLYRDVTFPFLIRVTRTLRVGEVYFGADKLAHLFGFGSRYYNIYLDRLEKGKTEAEAVEDAILWGVFLENTILGTGINGIFSYADLEANYQGLRLARSFCEHSDSYLNYDGRRWVLTRPIHLAEYVTPGFDESFYANGYSDALFEKVRPVLAEVFNRKADDPRVGERFDRYRQNPITHSMQVISAHQRTKGVEPPDLRILEALGVTPEDPRAPLVLR